MNKVGVWSAVGAISILISAGIFSYEKLFSPVLRLNYTFDVWPQARGDFGTEVLHGIDVSFFNEGNQEIDTSYPRSFLMRICASPLRRINEESGFIRVAAHKFDRKSEVNSSDGNLVFVRLKSLVPDETHKLTVLFWTNQRVNVETVFYVHFENPPTFARSDYTTSPNWRSECYPTSNAEDDK